LFYTYILINKSASKTYTGSTTNLGRRLSEHNSGKVSFSRAYRPYEIVHYEVFESQKEAREKEKFYKSTTGRRRLKVIIAKWKADRNFL